MSVMGFERYLEELGYSDRYIRDKLSAIRYLIRVYGIIPDKDTIRADMWKKPKSTRKRYYEAINLYEHYREVRQNDDE